MDRSTLGMELQSKHVPSVFRESEMIFGEFILADDDYGDAYDDDDDDDETNDPLAVMM